MMGNMGGGGGGGMGRCRRFSPRCPAEEAARFHQPLRAAGARDAARRPPPKYRVLIMNGDDMPESSTRRCPSGAHRRIYKVGTVKGWSHPHLRGHLAQGRPPAHRRGESTSSQRSRRTRRGPRFKDMVNEALITAIRDEREAIEWKDIIRAKQRLGDMTARTVCQNKLDYITLPRPTQ